MEVNSKLYFPQNRFSHQMTEMLFKKWKKGEGRIHDCNNAGARPVRNLSRQLVDNLFLVLFTRLPVCVTLPVWRGEKKKRNTSKLHCVHTEPFLWLKMIVDIESLHHCILETGFSGNGPVTSLNAVADRNSKRITGGRNKPVNLIIACCCSCNTKHRITNAAWSGSTALSSRIPECWRRMDSKCVY